MAVVAFFAAMIGEGDRAVGAVEDMAALGADEKGGETAAVDEKERLSPLAEIAFQGDVHLREKCLPFPAPTVE